jgi:hypothetical protein
MALYLLRSDAICLTHGGHGLRYAVLGEDHRAEKSGKVHCISTRSKRLTCYTCINTNSALQ